MDARMTVGEHAERVHFGVVRLGNADVFLGHDWLAHHTGMAESHYHYRLWLRVTM